MQVNRTFFERAHAWFNKPLGTYDRTGRHLTSGEKLDDEGNAVPTSHPGPWTGKVYTVNGKKTCYPWLYKNGELKKFAGKLDRAGDRAIDAHDRAAHWFHDLFGKPK